MALGGVMAALAVVIMCLGTLVPIATYTCPVICILMVHMIRKATDSRTAWAWYGAVAILSVLMAPDKEAAAVFASLGYYPLIKPRLDKMKLSLLWKGLLFNAVVILLYWMMLHLLGISQVVRDYAGIGFVMTGVMLFLGNVIFFMVDILLTRGFRKRKRKNMGR